MSEKKNAEKKQDETALKQAAGGKQSAVIYMGPAIAGVTVQGTIYKNGLTPQMQKKVQELPAMSRLLVPVEQTAKVRKELRDPQSAVSVCYQKTAEYVSQKGADR